MTDGQRSPDPDVPVVCDVCGTRELLRTRRKLVKRSSAPIAQPPFACARPPPRPPNSSRGTLARNTDCRTSSR